MSHGPSNMNYCRFNSRLNDLQFTSEYKEYQVESFVLQLGNLQTYVPSCKGMKCWEINAASFHRQTYILYKWNC